MPQSQSFDYQAETFGRLEVKFDHRALEAWDGWSLDDINQYRLALDFKRLSDIKYFSKRYNIPGFIAICGLSNITLTEWLGLEDDPHGVPSIILECVVDAVEKASKSIQDKQEDARRQMQLQALDVSSSLNLGKPNSTFGRVFG